MKDITVRELLERYPGRGYIVWYNDLWLLNCVKLRPLSKWEESILEYKVKYYDDSVNRENDPLSIEVY